MKPRLLLALLFLSLLPTGDAAESPLRISVYAAAGGVNRYLRGAYCPTRYRCRGISTPIRVQ